MGIGLAGLGICALSRSFPTDFQQAHQSKLRGNFDYGDYVNTSNNHQVPW
jgi:hypothetical protein